MAFPPGEEPKDGQAVSDSAGILLGELGALRRRYERAGAEFGDREHSEGVANLSGENVEEEDHSLTVGDPEEADELSAVVEALRLDLTGGDVEVDEEPGSFEFGSDDESNQEVKGNGDGLLNPPLRPEDSDFSGSAEEEQEALSLESAGNDEEHEESPEEAVNANGGDPTDIHAKIRQKMQRKEPVSWWQSLTEDWDKNRFW
jgi:hypothetical protein